MLLLRLAVVATGLSLAGPVAVAQAKELPRVAVKCVDADGKPVADAEVHVFQSKKSPSGSAEYIASGPHRTGADGVAVTAVAVDYDGGRFDRWFHARVPGKLVGGLRWLRYDDTPPAEPVIRMGPTREVRGRVHVPEGVTKRSVRVRTLAVAVLDGRGPAGTPLPRNSELAGLRHTLPELFDADVGDDGAFVLRDLPDPLLLYLAAEGPGLAQAQWFNATLPGRRIPDLVEMKMTREAVLEGVVVDARGRPVADAAVSARLDRCADGGPGVRVPFETRSDANGHFRLDGLPAAEFSLTVVHAGSVVRPALVQLAAAAHQNDLRIEVEEGVEVRGIVRGRPDGVAVERVGVVAIADDERQWRLGFAQTNAQGQFSLRLPRGTAKLYVAGVPRGYQQPTPNLDELLRIDVAPGDKTLTGIVFELEPAK